MSQTPNTTQKLYHIGIVALFLISIFAVMPTVTAAVGAVPVVRITERDYTTAAPSAEGVSFVFGQSYVPTATAPAKAGGATVFVSITHPDSDATDERDLFRGVTAHTAVAAD